MTALKLVRKLNLAERLSHHSQPASGGCVVWTGYIEPTGYATIRYKGKRLKAHRASWVSRNGEIPDGMQVLHKCDNRACINPEHLFLGTQMDNMRDMTAKCRDKRKGEQNGRSKLTENDVKRIRLFSKYLAMNGVLLAELFEVSSATVYEVLARKKWAYVNEQDLL